MSLSGEQLDAWRAANRAPVLKDQRNRWVFIVSRAFASTDDDIHRVLRGLLGRLERGAVDDFELIRTSPTRITPVGVVKRREDLRFPPLPFVEPGPVTWAEVEFAWRSATPDVPWPAERLKAGLFPVDDPEEAEMMLDSVGGSAGKAKPPGSPIGEAIDDALDSALETPQRTAVTVGVIGLIGLWLWSRRK